jgi:general secretion pathway protein I
MMVRDVRGFTLLEVMVAIAILGIAMLGLLSLHHQSLQSVMRAQDTTQAAMLAQAVMTNAELARFPDLGTSRGDFHEMFKEDPNLYRNYRWEQRVEGSGMFPDIRKVRIVIYYGPGMNRTFALTEFLHSPLPQNEGAATP